MFKIRICLILIALLFVSVDSNEDFLGMDANLIRDLANMSQEELNILASFMEDPSTAIPSTSTDDPSTSTADPSTSTADPSTSTADPSTPTPSGSSATPSKVGLGTWDLIVSSFWKLTDGWSKIVNAFKTTRSSELKQKLLGKGFDYFSQSAAMQISKGIKGQYIDAFLDHVQTRIKVPAERTADLKMVLEECKWVESNIWTAYNTLFSINQGGDTKFASILIARNDANDTYDFFYNDIKAEFNLAPNTLVVSKKLSVLGGIWEDSKDEYIKVPKTLTTEDISTVLQFFQIVAFKGFAEQLGIKLEFPK
jgi:hypothetical protein